MKTEEGRGGGIAKKEQEGVAEEEEGEGAIGHCL